MNPFRPSDTPSQFRLSRSDRVYDGKLLKIDLERLSLPGGRHAELEIIRHPGAAAVVPLRDDGSVVMIRQYRHAANGFIFEIPAGKLDHGEAPELCAIRETVEEVGLRPATLHHLGAIHTTPGFTDELIHLYAGVDLQEAEQDLDEDETLEVFTIPLLDALQAIRDGEVTDAKTICALLRLDQEIRSGRISVGSDPEG